MPVHLQSAVAYSGTVENEIEGRRIRAKHDYDRKLGRTPHDAIQPRHWVYVKPYPHRKHSAWPHGVVEEVSSPRSYTVITPNAKIRRNRVQIRLTAAPPTDVKTYMSQCASSQTEQSDSGDDFASPIQPLRFTNGPKPPHNQGLQSPQEESPNHENQLSPAKSQSPAIKRTKVQF